MKYDYHEEKIKAMTDKYMNKRVLIKYTKKVSYMNQNIVGMEGTVRSVSNDEIGVRIDGKNNNYSSVGHFWFKESELEILDNDIENESEDIVMEGYKYVAIVNLVEDSYNKDYAFALYEDDYYMITAIEEVDSPAMVVVNARTKNNRLLATVKRIVPIEEYCGNKITAEVIGTVNMNNHVHREEERIRLAELAKKRAAIEAELEKEINKRKSVEYYEEMARKYSDNPRLAELVGELRGLGA